MAVIPEDLSYTNQHEWVATRDGLIRVGITDFAQDALGDIVYVQLPAVGTVVTGGEALGEVESTKSVSDIFAPISGSVVARNERLAEAPELINTDPYGEGWLVEIEPSEPDPLAGLLDAAGYRSLTQS